MTWYRDPGITCNCTRPPVEQPDHRRRLILAPKPSSALYNTRPSTLLRTTLYNNLHPYTSLPRLNTSRSPWRCSVFWVLRTQHRTRYCTLLHFCWESWWHRVPELRLDSPSSGTVTTPCSWWSSHTTRRQILASRKKNRRWQGLLFKIWIS